MGLEIPTGKTPGEEIRRTPAPQPAFIGFCILALTALIFVFAALIFTAVYDGASIASLSPTEIDPAIKEAPMGGIFRGEQVIIAFWLACLFFCLYEVIFLYQRFFMDHVTIAKKRFRKWEDEGVQLR